MNIGNMRHRFWVLPVGVAALGMLVVGLLYSAHSIAAPGVTWTPISITQEIARGQSLPVTVTFTASENLTNINVRVVPALQSLVQVSPLSFASIQKGKPVTVTITLAAPANTPIGTTSGTIQLLSGSSTLAKPLPVTVTYRGDLPPDPGEAGKATIEGIDLNGNGVRDDIERWIAFNYPGSEKTRTALAQQAMAVQDSLIVGRNKDAPLALQTDNKAADANACLIYVIGSVNQQIALSKTLLATSLNTRARSLAYLDFGDLLAGEILLGARKDKKSGCYFDPDAMGN